MSEALDDLHDRIRDLLAARDLLAKELGEVKAELKECRNDRDCYGSELQMRSDQLDAAMAENERREVGRLEQADKMASQEYRLHAAMAALRKYGMHHGFRLKPSQVDQPACATVVGDVCTCGLDAALADNEV